MNIRKFFISLARIIVLVYLGLCAYYYLFQEQILFHPDKTVTATPKDIRLAYKDLTLTTSDGIEINAWYIPAPRARATVLFSHGNGGNIGIWLDSISIMHELGLNVLVYDYRGFGKSEGSPDEKGTYLDAEAAWEYLINKEAIAPKRIILWGQSLGSAMAIELATRKKAGALIAESGFTSVAAVAKMFIPYLPADLLVRNRYANIDKVSSITIPSLFIHSTDDEMIPFAQSRELYERTPSASKELLAITGSHNSGRLFSEKLYTGSIDRFMTKHFGPAALIK